MMFYSLNQFQRVLYSILHDDLAPPPKTLTPVLTQKLPTLGLDGSWTLKWMLVSGRILKGRKVLIIV